MQLIRGLAGNPPAQGLPPIQEYIDCAEQRRQTIVRYAHGNGDFFRVGHLTQSSSRKPNRHQTLG
jgi:hypothetical protein